MASPTPLTDFLGTVQEEFNHFMLGEFLGGGKYRSVYALPADPDNYVIKIENTLELEFCNVNEWNVWNELWNTPAGKWLAPCRSISRGGAILCQARTKPITKIPEKVPYFLTDCHDGNWGLYEGRPVMHDYGFLGSFVGNIANSKKHRMVLRKNA